MRGRTRHLRRLPRARLPAPEPLPARSRPCSPSSGVAARRGLLDRPVRVLAGRARPRERGLTGQAEARTWSRCCSARGRVLISSEAPLPADLAEFAVHGPGGEDPPPPRARPAGRGRVGDDVVGGRGARRARGVHRDHGPGLHRRRGAALRAGAALHRGPVRHGAVAPIEKIFAESPRDRLAASARQRLLDEKIDVTQWMVDYFEIALPARGRGRSLPMCGIAGTFGFGDDALVRAMTDTIAHRGPDGEGFYMRRRRPPRQPAARDPGRAAAARSRWPTRTAPSSSSTTARSTTTPSCATWCWPAGTAAHPLRHRDPRPPLRGRGHRVRRPAQRHLRVRAVRPAGAARCSWSATRSGSSRWSYSVTDGKLALRVRGQGRARQRARRRRARRGQPAPVDERPLRPRATGRSSAASASSPPGHVLEFTDGAAPRLHPYTTIDWTPDETPEPRRVDGGDPAPLPARRSSGSCSPTCRSASRCPAASTRAPIVAMLRRTTSGPDQDLQPRLRRALTTRLDDARFVARDLRHRAPRGRAARARPRAPRRRHPAHRGAQGQLAAAVPAAPVHRRARAPSCCPGLGGDELFAGYDFYGYLHRGRRLRSGARAPRCAPSRPPLDWAARRVAGARPAAARPGHAQARVAGRLRAIAARQLPAPAQRLGLQPGAAAARVHAGVRRPAPRVDPGRVRRLLRRRAAARVRRPCGPSSRPRWCATCCTTRTPCRWRTRWSPGSRCSTSSWSGSPPASPTTCASAAGPKGLLKDALTGRAPRPRAAQAEMGLHLRSGRAVPEGPRARWPGRC